MLLKQQLLVSKGDYVWSGRKKNAPISGRAFYIYLTRYMKVPVTIPAEYRRVAADLILLDRATAH